MQRTFEAMPFCVGPQPTNSNPKDIPDTFPLTIRADVANGCIAQVNRPELDKLLRRAYKYGFAMGTPTADTDLGAAYAEDFLQYVWESAGPPGRALEIGAGVGYLSSQLIANGWDTDALEPGKGYEAYWKHLNVEVINDFFPSQFAKGPYDLVIMYAVLEHIFDVETFLRAIVEHLSEDGRIILAVPDCSVETTVGDPSMLVHEHYHYFTAPSLRRTLESQGLQADVRASGYGRSLYAIATPAGAEGSDFGVTDAERSVAIAYFQKLNELTEDVLRLLRSMESGGSVGVFCPARALAYLPVDSGYRFFDDAPDLHGKFYPPFASQIESRDELISSPVGSLFIPSWTFGDRLAAKLRTLLPDTDIYAISEIASRG